MKISNNRTLKELQEEFQKYYPFLHIEFYKKPHREGSPSKEEDLLDPAITIKQARAHSTTGYIALNGYQNVGKFEQIFSKSFGLNVQVFRKSYGQWLQTWATDMWTLDEQNERGRIVGNRR